MGRGGNTAKPKKSKGKAAEKIPPKEEQAINKADLFKYDNDEAATE